MADWYTDNSKKHSSTNVEKPPPLKFHSRRSPVICRNGCVSSSQPLASSIGLQILRDKGGNAVDASIAVAAALAVLEPCSTGLGGDMFALVYSAKDRKVHAINGSGRSAAAATMEQVKESLHVDKDKIEDIEYLSNKLRFHALAVTVPGAARGWEDLYHKFGSGNISFADLLEPAAQLADEGFPVAMITAKNWQTNFHMITKWLDKDTQNDDIPLSVNGKPPNVGEIIFNPDMAKVLRSLGKNGASKGFYESFPGHAIVKAIEKHGGLMQLDDLKNHFSTFPDPIKASYRGINLWQVPPNGQGIAGLIALKGIRTLEESKLCDELNTETVSQSAGAFHAMIEMMRLGFGDARKYVCDTDYNEKNENLGERKDSDMIGSNGWLLDDTRIANRAQSIFDNNKAVVQGEPHRTSCTVSFQVVDKEGNAISFVNSNFMGFGTGIVPDGCGFTLQNRGSGFSFDQSHPNAIAPSKRPYHTIIPGMLTHIDTNELFATLSNMGGYMQPQGHMQLTIAMVAGNLDPQATVDLPRFCIADGTHDGVVFLEDGVNEMELKKLKNMGHKMKTHISGYARSMFGRAQIIKRDRNNGVLWAGSDGRSDGCAMGY